MSAEQATYRLSAPPTSVTLRQSRRVSNKTAVGWRSLATGTHKIRKDFMGALLGMTAQKRGGAVGGV